MAPKTDDDTGRKDDQDANDEDDANDQTDDDGQDGGEDDFDKERALKTIKAQRESEKALRKEVSDMKATLKKFETKDMAADELTKKERDELATKVANYEVKYRKTALKAAAQYEAGRMNFQAPEIAYRMIDSDDVEWDEDEPTNVKSLLREVLKEYPNLKRTRSANGDDGDEGDDNGQGRNSRRSGNDMNSLMRDAIGNRGR